MHTNMRTKLRITALLLVVMTLLGSGLTWRNAQAALPATPCISGGGIATCDLWAKTGSITLPAAPSPLTVTIWGYADSAGGTTGLPGPVLIVNQGDSVTVNLTNNLSEPTAMLFQGQAMIPDTTGVAPGGTKAYTFTASKPGTFLYEAGLLPNAQHQVAMGLYGALVVLPATPGQAYNSADSAFDDQSLLVLSELDQVLNNSPSPAAFDMRSYKPKYFLINVKAYPQTDPIDAPAGSDYLLRYVNAGLQAHSMVLLGFSQRVLAMDGNLFLHSHSVAAESIAPGQTSDAIINVPSTTTPGSKFALFDSTLMLHNNRTAGLGGMLAFLNVGVPTPPGGDTTGPATSGILLAPNPTDGTVDVSVSASVSDLGLGDSNITAAEFVIDSTLGITETMTAADSAFDSPTEAVQGTIPAATMASLASGNHIIYVRGQDAAGNWGAYNFAVLNLDAGGPTTSGLTLTPNPTNGTVNVALSATGDDRSSGNGNIAAAEYTIDGGAPIPMTVNNPAPVANLTATIPAATVNALSEGPHTIAVRSQDDQGNWGALATIDLIVDKTGPGTSGVSAAPNPNNGTQGFNSNTLAVRVSASFSDGASNISTGEGFIDTAGANGTGFPFAPSDGLFNSATENGYADIPLTTIAQLSNGPHTIYVHGKDAAGNWGATNTVVLVIDKTGPVTSGLTLTPGATNNAAVAISANADDTATGNSNITAGEYFIDTPGANGSGTSMSVSAAAPSASLSATIPAATVAALSAGNHTVYVHARDAANNWGALVTATLLIDRTAPTFSSITLAPNPTNGATTVTLTVNGASDGAGGSGVVGGEYWFGTTNPAPGGGTAFTGLTANIPVGSLANGTYTVRARIIDAAGNWSSGASGIRSATLTVNAPPADAIFSDGFESGNFSAWSATSTGNATRLSVTAGAALVGSFGMQAQGNNTNYVGSVLSTSAATYDARFYFRPNGNSTAGQDIFSAASTGGFGSPLFRIRYRLNAGQPQVQIQLGTANTNTVWANINGGTASNFIEVVWQAVGSGGPNPGTLQLYVNGALADTLTTTSTGSVVAIRMGSVTNGGSSTLEYFDAFASKRSTTPLIGP